MADIVILHKLTEESQERIRAVAPGRSLALALTEEDRRRELPEAEIVAGWHPDAAGICLKPGTKLRWLQGWGAGVDRFPLADMAACGVIMTNASGVHAYPISELIVTFMLMLTQGTQRTVRNQLGKHWRPGRQAEIHGATVGILGVGAIGLETARIAQAFGMTVLGMRTSPEPLPGVDRMYAPDGLDAMLAQCDYVVNTLPHTPETDKLMNKERFAAMKRSAYYINIGRGRTTDEQALIAALRDGTIAGAGLDVFEQEPLPADSPLWEMDNVIITPHQAGATVHYEERAVAIFVRNLQVYVDGREPSESRVDLAKRY
ncbi:D-2-hydroxyacid dehydrogenase [Paenibacillus cymbidii]|uniref:D-2-hydroxyacid dehydrogenase n=1 Tax=Paenibacillus cymbidii TaxID=1639034 RepID=UPI001081D2B6|nr:D-2-hydroxyacid dehydrogenase [Paenibacillus cymbidii]